MLYSKFQIYFCNICYLLITQPRCIQIELCKLFCFFLTGIQNLQLFKSMATLPAKLDAIPAVDIDSGRFKYVLIRVDMQETEAETKQEYSKVIVRGYSWAAFHGKCQQRSHTKKISFTKKQNKRKRKSRE